jgi:hypothetical protein
MSMTATLPTLSDVMLGSAVFTDAMPIWLGTFGDDEWPFIETSSPSYAGRSAACISWRNMCAKNSGEVIYLKIRRYEYCLLPEMVSDLKVAAVIYSRFPQIIKNARVTKVELDPKTVKSRIDDLAKFFSMVVIRAKKHLNAEISCLSDVPFSLVKEVIPTFPGRGQHLKRALKLISDPVVQKNLRKPLQWGLLDITKSSLAWGDSIDEGGYVPFSDEEFLFLLDVCKAGISNFKKCVGLAIHDSECGAIASTIEEVQMEPMESEMIAYVKQEKDLDADELLQKPESNLANLREILRNGHNSAMLAILLLTGMRHSETHFVKRGCLQISNGFWFLISKVIKHRPKDYPISDDWLAIDIVRDAYDILMFITKHTDNDYLFSSPKAAEENKMCYRGTYLNTKFIRWIEKIDKDERLQNISFSTHRCRETLVAQLANQQVGMTFISMQLKHFHRQFDMMPNSVSAGYGNYRKQLMTNVTNRIAGARETALIDVYGENANFAGGGGAAHKARIDTFFSGLGLYGKEREQYIRRMATRGVELLPTSIGNCAKNFSIPTVDSPPPCYGDFQCDPNCSSHIITQRSAMALVARKEHALAEAGREVNSDYKTIWIGMVETLDRHIAKLDGGGAVD